MPRRPIVYTNFYPYHIVARANNREWFSLDADSSWSLFSEILNKSVALFGFRIHAFVLMSNHYHLIASTEGKFPLGYIMCEVQKSFAKEANRRSGRINHVFGGRYRPSLITSSEYYENALKYVYRNPVHANIVNLVSEYQYSTLNQFCALPLSPNLMFERHQFDSHQAWLNWMNTAYTEAEYIQVREGLKKRIFKPATRSRLLRV